MRRFVLANPFGSDLEFDGERLLSDSSIDLGQVDIYRTAGGRWVAKQNRAALRGRSAQTRVDVLENVEALGEWLGYSEGAKKILEKLEHSSRTFIS